MENLSKLKAMLAQEVTNRQIYKDGLDAVKEVESLGETKKELESAIKRLGGEVEKEKARADTAKANAKRIEDEYAAYAAEAKARIDADLLTAEKQIEAMTLEARESVKELDARARGLTKTIKDKEAKAQEAEDNLVKAEAELEKVRTKLRSI